MEKHAKIIDNFCNSNGDVMYLSEKDSKIRASIHQYMHDKYSGKYIVRTEYVAHGTEIWCCDGWYKSSNYGYGWNGGSITCLTCGEDTYADYSDCEDASNRSDIRFSKFRSSGNMMVCKVNFPYKKRGKYPFSYRKRYPNNFSRVQK
jgi:hypothetical protein